jgi:undecaprenyl diphosphate synthase
MELFSKFLKKFLKKILKNEIKLVVTGERSGLSESLIKQIDDAEEKSKNFEKVLNLAINYGGKQEIVSAVNKLIESGVKSVTEDDIQSNLYAPFIPPIDLVVRTSGEQRISNFYLWQSAYSELYFTDALWPDFNEAEIDKALLWYASRNRRFGKI